MNVVSRCWLKMVHIKDGSRVMRDFLGWGTVKVLYFGYIDA
jgi:hypothetical protein